MSKLGETDKLLAAASSLIESITNELTQFSDMNRTNGRRKRAAISDPHNGAACRVNCSTPNRAVTTADIEIELQQISRVVEDVDHNLSIAGIPITDVDDSEQNASIPIPGADEPVSPANVNDAHPSTVVIPIADADEHTANNNDIVEIIDLSETQNETPANQNPIIVDLCTPAREQTRTRRRSSTAATGRIRRNNAVTVPLPMIEPSPDDCTYRIEVITTPAEPEYMLPRREKFIPPTDAKDAMLSCPICLGSAHNNKPTSTKCGHVFCYRCIIQAIRINGKCPLCNAKASEKNLIRLYF